MTLVSLDHDFGEGHGAYPGLPQPVIRDHMTFEQSQAHYAPGTEFSIRVVEMVANTGTYLDTPAHRYRDGYDLAGLPLDRVAGVEGVVIDAVGPAIEMPVGEVAGMAVLIRTGWSRHWGSPEYASGRHPFLTTAMVARLVASGPAVVGIDSHNIDSTDDPARPAHSGLLGAGIPIVEHLTDLDRLPERGFRFFAVPPRFAGVGTFPVRAFAIVG